MEHHGNKWGTTISIQNKEDAMKNKMPRRPTRKQKEQIVAAGYKPENWLVLEADKLSMTIVNKESRRKKVILC